MENEIEIANAARKMTELTENFTTIVSAFGDVAKSYMAVTKGIDPRQNGLTFAKNINFLRVETIKMLIANYESVKSEFNYEILKNLMAQFEFEASHQLNDAINSYNEILKIH